MVGVIDRETKQAFAKVMLANKQGKKLTGKQLLSVLEELTKGNVTVMTDEFRGYNILSHDLRFFHDIINHQHETPAKTAP